MPALNLTVNSSNYVKSKFFHFTLSNLKTNMRKLKKYPCCFKSYYLYRNSSRHYLHRDVQENYIKPMKLVI